MLKRVMTTAAIAAALVLVAPIPVSANGPGSGGEGGGAGCGDIECWIWGGVGGEGGGGDGTSGGGPAIEIGFTPGDPTCFSRARNEEVPCSVGYLGDNYWSNSRQCYTALATALNQDPSNRPRGSTAANGAWYVCYTLLEATGTNTTAGGTFWANTPPPGITTYSPAQAARIVTSRFQLRGIEIGRTPEGGDKTYIGLPVWLWANNPQPLNYGPYTETVTVGGQTVTATATVSSITWDMGDGTRFPCGQGTPYDESYGITASPTCDHTYTRVGSYEITATSNWIVVWSGGGARGQIGVQTPSSTTLEIGQLQSVNVQAP